MISYTEKNLPLSLAVQPYFLLRPAQAPRLNPFLSFSIASATLTHTRTRTHTIRQGFILIDVPVTYTTCIYLFLFFLLLLYKMSLPLSVLTPGVPFSSSNSPPPLPSSLPPIANHPQNSITGRVRRERGREGAPYNQCGHRSSGAAVVSQSRVN